MVMSTLIKKKIAKYLITTNLDGLHRRSGLEPHTELCNLHGCIYAERCTSCGYEFQRNYYVRRTNIHPHDHKVLDCEKCGSKTLPEFKGVGKVPMVHPESKDMGTKDTHINFEESLDDIDWNEAEYHCRKSDLVIVAGTSMTLRHITHFPFYAQKNKFGKSKKERGKVVIINLQETPDDDKCDLRIFAKTDFVFERVMYRLGLE